MRPILYAFAVTLAILGCATAERAAEKTAAPPARGLVVQEYSGAFAGHPRLRRALTQLPEALVTAEGDLASRLGLELDPDLPRRIVLTDDEAPGPVTSRIRGGRRVQEIPVSAGVLARGRAEAGEVALDAVARAAIADLVTEGIPDWFAAGAPLWLSGEWERILNERLIGRALIPATPGERLPPIRLDGGGNDVVTSALFLRFLAVEFGGERMPDLGRALAAGGAVPDALRAAFRTDPASVPNAFDGFRLRVASEILDDPYVRELAAARALPAEQRNARLSGLAGRTADPWVEAAILEERAVAEYGAGRYEAAADTLARVERDHVRHALSLDRDRFLLALTFLARDESDAAALRLRSFVAEFPGSPWRGEARFRLGEILLTAGRGAEAMAEFRQVVESGTGGPFAVRAAVALGAFELSQYRFGVARRWLRHAPDSGEATRLLEEIEDLEEKGLPYEARLMVEGAVAALRGGPGPRADAAARTLEDVGAPAAGLLLAGFEGAPADWPDTLVTWSLSLASAWKTSGGDQVLLRLLASERSGVVPAAFRELVARGRSPEEIRAACPEGGEARALWERRFGAGGVAAEVMGLVAGEGWQDRAAGAERLGSTPGPEAALRLVGMAADESPLVRAAVARALGRRGEADLSGALETLSRDPSAGVRVQAFRAQAARGEWVPVVAGFGEDPDVEIRAQCAALLLESGRPGSVGLVVGGLGEEEPGVRVMVEALLRETDAAGVGPALADALAETTRPGHAMRIVRVIADRAGSDFGYDPAGGEAERLRVAEAFRRFLAASDGER